MAASMLDIIGLCIVHHVPDSLYGENPSFRDTEVDRVRGTTTGQAFLSSSLTRPPRVKHVQEYGWLTVSESFLAMTIFRDEFDAKFVLIFSTVLFTKGFHWIARDRVDYVPRMDEGGPGRIHLLRWNKLP